MGYTRFDFSTFSTIKREYNSAYVCVVVDGDLVVDDHELVEGVDGDDDRGVTVPGQVDGVCRYPV